MIINVFVLAVLLSACNPAKRIQEPQVLLDRNVIVQNNSKIKESAIYAIIKQRPNVYTLTKFRIRLHLYNLGNPKRIARVNEQLNKKVERKNSKRRLKNEGLLLLRVQDSLSGKKLKELKLKKMAVKRNSLGESFQSAGEAPVLLDSALNEVTNKQIKLFMFKNGYFNAEVRDSIVVHNKKAAVHYVIDAHNPYVIEHFIREIDNKDKGEIRHYIEQLNKTSLIHEGDRFDMEILNQERSRITSALRDSGFHFFNKEYVYFEYDTTEAAGKLNLFMDIHNIKTKDQFADSIVLVPHKRYKISGIDIRSNYDPRVQKPNYDSVGHYSLNVMYRTELNIKPKVLHKKISYKSGDYYNHSAIESSFKKLSNLGLFKLIHMNFENDSAYGQSEHLKSVINLEPLKTKTFALESNGTHTDGLLGIEGRLSFSNKNLFKKAIQGQISLIGGLEAQRSILSTDNNNLSSDLTGLAASLNTLEFSPQISFTLPSYLLRFTGLLDDHNNPKTEIITAYNFQRRPDFTRNIFSLSGATIINEKRAHTLRIDWPEFSLVNIYNESSSFLSRIDLLNDKFLAATYQDHIISASRVTYEYNNQHLNNLNNNFYFKAALEQSGNLLRWGFEKSKAPIDELGGYEVFNTRFAQYIKATIDARYYRNFKKSQIVYRIFAGIGIPQKNFSEALPFEKAFFAGGANGIRAWKSRTLGPGGYYDSNKAFDKTGDIRIEFNAEARFDVIDWIEGAIFADIGNVWLLNPDSLRSNGHFQWKRSLPRELALGGGVGIRMDLDFFLIRLDFAIPLHNPSLTDGNRWIFKSSNRIDEEFKPQFVLGIGYPF